MKISIQLNKKDMQIILKQEIKRYLRTYEGKRSMELKTDKIIEEMLLQEMPKNKLKIMVKEAFIEYLEKYKIREVVSWLRKT